MKITAQQLTQQLQQNLPPIIWISGDEPLLTLEAADQVRMAARAAGINERQVFHADTGFDWNVLQDANQSMSLFGDRQLLEVRLSAKLKDDGRKALVAYAANANPDNVLLVQSDRLEAAQSKAKWFNQVIDQGWWLPIWPVERHQFTCLVASATASSGTDHQRRCPGLAGR